MGDFNRSRRSGRGFGRRDFGEKRYSSRPIEMHSAICSKCKNECQVPFQPTGNKPVYCRDCFSKIKDVSFRGSFGGNKGNERPAFYPANQNNEIQSMGDHQLICDINAKLDRILTLLANNSPKEAKTETSELPQKVEKPVKKLKKV